MRVGVTQQGLRASCSSQCRAEGRAVRYATTRHRTRCHAAADQAAGVEDAFTPGKEAGARRAIFNNVSSAYDELNDQLSFGQHWVWKRMAVKWSGAKPGQRVLDVCCGSGDLSFLMASAVGSTGQVVGLDFAENMLSDAAQRQKVQQQALPPNRKTAMQWVQGDALDMPFGVSEFDAATMGYGLRNVASIPTALAELHRVLKPGAAVAVLDFNNSSNILVDSVQALFLEQLVVPAARRYGLQAEYEYLRPSIKAFPTGAALEQMAREAGFAQAVYYEIAFGLMGCLVARKSR